MHPVGGVRVDHDPVLVVDAADLGEPVGKAGERLGGVMIPPPSGEELQRQPVTVCPLDEQPVQAEAAKTPGMAVMGLAGEIVVALLADENDGGYDLEAGLFGPAFSTLARRWADAEWLATQPQAIPAAPTVQASGEREAFEAKWPTPPGCQWTGNGYASIRHHDWAADDHAKRWEGWKARAAIASPPAINPPKGE